jgi:hypothetical protein
LHFDPKRAQICSCQTAQKLVSERKGLRGSYTFDLEWSGNGAMTAKKLILLGLLILGTAPVAATAASAQGYYYGQSGYYYGYGPRAGYGAYYYGPARSNCDRGGPGPRVGCGSGLGIGAVR